MVFVLYKFVNSVMAPSTHGLPSLVFTIEFVPVSGSVKVIGIYEVPPVFDVWNPDCHFLI